MGADDPAFGIWGPLTSGEGGVSNLTKANSEFGAVRDARKILFRLCDNDKFTKGNSFTVETSSYSRKFNSLMSQENKALILKLKEFDDCINTAGFRATITRLEDEITDRTEREASFQVKVLNGGSLDKGEKRAREENKELLESASEDLKELMDKLFSCYEEFTFVRSAIFKREVQSHCLQTVVGLAVRRIRTVKLAYEKNEDGDLTETRLSQHDSAEQPTSAYGFKWCYEWHTMYVDEPRGRNWDTFVHCREFHIKTEFPDPGHAEAQYDYFMRNLRIPRKMYASNLLQFIDSVSDIMYLLPSIKDHPNGKYQNQSDLVARNKPFSPFDKAQMLFNAMPLKVQQDYRADNVDDPIPLDPQLLARVLEYKLSEHWKEQEKSDPSRSGSNGGSGGGGSKSQHQGPRTPKQSGAGSGQAQKKCERCIKANEHKRVWQTHNASSCTRYHADGRKINHKVDREINAHSGDRERTPGSARKRKAKKAKKSKKRKKDKKPKKRSRKKAKRHESSSESGSDDGSSSDSDSSVSS